MNSPQLELAESPAPAPAAPPSHQRRRPFGLYMILILLTLQVLLGAFLAVVFGLGLTMAPGEIRTKFDLHFNDLLEPAALMLVSVVLAFGLWRYRAWGWYGMMLLLAYGMTTDAITYFIGRPDYGSMLLSVAMVFYLNQREVRDLFETPAAGKEVA